MKKILPVIAALLVSCGRPAPVRESGEEDTEVVPEAPKRFVVTDEYHRPCWMSLIVVYDTVTSNETVIARSGQGMATVSHRQIK